MGVEMRSMMYIHHQAVAERWNVIFQDCADVVYFLVSQNPVLTDLPLRKQETKFSVVTPVSVIIFTKQH